MALRGSAAFAIPIVLVTAFLVGSLMLTVLDPLWQAFFDSAMWQTNNSSIQMMLDAVKALTTYIGLFLLLGYLSRSWIWTRRAG